MEAKHTPGPWFVSRLPEGYPESINADGPTPIATMPRSAKTAANAALIAAAPELLAALERYVKLEEESAPYSLAPMLIAARAAIAKAKGGA